MSDARGRPSWHKQLDRYQALASSAAATTNRHHLPSHKTPLPGPSLPASTTHLNGCWDTKQSCAHPTNRCCGPTHPRPSTHTIVLMLALVGVSTALRGVGQSSLCWAKRNCQLNGPGRVQVSAALPGRAAAAAKHAAAADFGGSFACAVIRTNANALPHPVSFRYTLMLHSSRMACLQRGRPAVGVWGDASVCAIGAQPHAPACSRPRSHTCPLQPHFLTCRPCVLCQP